MNAKYYRYIFQKVNRGLCFSASVADCFGEGKQELRFVYLSGEGAKTMGDSAEVREMDAGQNMRGSGGEHREQYELLVLADFSRLTLQRAIRFLAENRVERVVYPAYEESETRSLAEKLEAEAAELALHPEEYLRAHEVREHIALKDKMTLERCGQEVRIFCLGTGCGRSLSLYHGSIENDPDTQECLMHVKPVLQEECPAIVDAQNLNFEMSFVLYNDFTNCKKQNRKNSEYFVDGQLLVGSMRLDEAMPILKGELRDVWKKIRFLGIPDGAVQARPGLWELGTPGTAQYVAGDLDTDAQVVRDVVIGNPYCRFVPLSENSGLCVSGYYAQR
ncbi:MAG: hypothetical protein Q4B57_08350 [Eubacteriales bacterium]|nr:hypothetical protein [Eubacteriales bacterium]